MLSGWDWRSLQTWQYLDLENRLEEVSPWSRRRCGRNPRDGEWEMGDIHRHRRRSSRAGVRLRRQDVKVHFWLMVGVPEERPDGPR